MLCVEGVTQRRCTCFRFQVSSFRFQVSGFRFQVSSFKFQVSSFRFQVSSFRFQVSVFKFQVSSFSFQVWSWFLKLYLNLYLNLYLLSLRAKSRTIEKILHRAARSFFLICFVLRELHRGVALVLSFRFQVWSWFMKLFLNL